MKAVFRVAVFNVARPMKGILWRMLEIKRLMKAVCWAVAARSRCVNDGTSPECSRSWWIDKISLHRVPRRFQIGGKTVQDVPQKGRVTGNGTLK